MRLGFPSTSPSPSSGCETPADVEAAVFTLGVGIGVETESVEMAGTEASSFHEAASETQESK